MLKTCYMCDSVATSIEHAPPKCIFPESKDTSNGENYRKNLITVPSCDLHNSARSKDDEYLLHVLAASITSNDVGLNQFLTKSRRAFERNPELIRLLPVSNVPVFNYITNTGDIDAAYPIHADGNRIDKVISSCARAIYFYDKGTKYSGNIKLIASFMSYQDKLIDKNVEKAIIFARHHFNSFPRKGDNKDVFYYQIDGNENSAIMLMCFYGDTNFLVHFDEKF